MSFVRDLKENSLGPGLFKPQPDPTRYRIISLLFKLPTELERKEYAQRVRRLVYVPASASAPACMQHDVMPDVHIRYSIVIPYPWHIVDYCALYKWAGMRRDGGKTQQRTTVTFVCPANKSMQKNCKINIIECNELIK